MQLHIQIKPLVTLFISDSIKPSNYSNRTVTLIQQSYKYSVIVAKTHGIGCIIRLLKLNVFVALKQS